VGEPGFLNYENYGGKHSQTESPLVAVNPRTIKNLYLINIMVDYEN